MGASHTIQLIRNQERIPGKSRQLSNYFVLFDCAFFVLTWLDCIWRLCSIGRQQISSCDFNEITGGNLWKASENDREFHRAGSVTIQHEENNFALINVMHGRRNDMVGGPRGLC